MSNTHKTTRPYQGWKGTDWKDGRMEGNRLEGWKDGREQTGRMGGWRRY
jgi:hypothetical protein